MFAWGKPWNRQPVSGKPRRKLGVSPGFAAHFGAPPPKRLGTCEYQDALKADDFIERKRVLAGFEHRPAPPFQPVPRRTLALDLEAGSAIRQQHEAGGARQEMRAGAAHGFPGLGREV